VKGEIEEVQKELLEELLDFVDLALAWLGDFITILDRAGVTCHVVLYSVLHT